MKQRILYLLAALTLTASLHQAADRYEDPPIQYSTATPTNAVSRLHDSLASGKTTLNWSDKHGYLPALLEKLGISTNSQVMVFSKTSLQNRHISPKTPRAIYFNEDHYVGTVQGGDVLEISTADPALGGVFYTIEQTRRKIPELTRQTDNCLQCHGGGLTRGIPGHIVRSVFPDQNGFPILRAGTFRTYHSSPLEERWGGWYVTGTHGKQRHMGNRIATESDEETTIDMEKGANLTTLKDLVDTSPYLTPHSDLIALMVLEHQVEMHNLITQANHDTRLALHDMKTINEVLGNPPDKITASTRHRINSVAAKVVDYMLFADEEPLSDRIAGTSGFADAFQKAGVRDQEGRSLRDLDLEKRMFKYPCSYLIYSESFDALPDIIRETIYRRMYDILTGEIDEDTYLYLTNSKTRAIIEILKETKPGLPEYWK